MIRRSQFVFILLSGLVFVSRAQETAPTEPLHPFLLDSTNYTIQPVSINSSVSEYSPIFKNQEMLFVSDRSKSVALGYNSGTDRSLTDIYVCEKIDSVRFKPAKLFSKTINTPMDDGPMCFNADKTMLIFSTNSDFHFSLLQEDTVRRNLLLYSSTLNNDKWSTPAKLPFCKGGYSYTHPYLTVDGSTLYFSSDMKGGQGGMDLYYSIWDEGTWSEPVNLGKEVNSPANEIFPFVSPDNILYFSSNRPAGFGGLDLYSISTAELSSGKIHLMESPLNTDADDFGISVNAGGLTGYFSSNRNKDEGDNIFYFRNKHPKPTDCHPYVAPSYCYTFYEESTGEGLDNGGVKLTYEWNLGDGSKVKGLEAKHCFMSPGVYNVELNIVEEASGAIFYNETSYEFTVEDAAQVYLNCPDTVSVNVPFHIGSEKSKITGSSILSYQWNFGDGKFSNGINGLYEYKKLGTYTIRLEVRSKNDSSGAISTSCIEKNIVVMDPSWRKVDNNKYLASANKKATYTTEKADSLNFRVFLGTSEAQIPKDANFFDGLTDVRESKMDSLYIYTSGNKGKALDLAAEYAKAKKNGFFNARVLAYSGDSLIPNIDDLLDVRIYDGITDLKKNSTTLNEFSSNIYFDAYADVIQEKYLPTLDFVAEMLEKQPELSVSIYAFTDTIGMAEFNEDVFEQARLDISAKRGLAIKKYFEKKGLKIPEINSIAKGEHIEEDREKLGTMGTNTLYNRRVTIYVKKKRE